MVWIQMSRDTEFRKSVVQWLAQQEYLPVLHSHLLMELFQTSRTDDFDDLWAIIEGYGFSNFSPLAIVHEEINFVFRDHKVDRDKMLRDAVFILSDDNREKYKQEYTNNSRMLREKAIATYGHEHFQKASRQYSLEIQKVKLGSVINDMLSRKQETVADFPAALENSAKGFLKRGERHQDVAIENISRLIARLRDNDPRNIIIGFVDNLVQEAGIPLSELLKLDVGEATYLPIHLRFLKNTYAAFDYRSISLDKFVEQLLLVPIELFPGYNMLKQLSESIRESEAIPRISDGIDFLNITYLPYVSLYVTDALIVDKGRQLFKAEKSKLISFREFKDMLVEAGVSIGNKL
ncbi:hypothetical protein [Leptonema illini]|nr:hypothetical protein [Leptonema illini]